MNKPQSLAGGKVRRVASQAAGGSVAAGDLLGDQKPQDLGGVPALRAGGGQHVGGGFAHIGQAHPAHQPVQLLGQGRGLGKRHGRIFLRWSGWAPIGSAGDQYGGAW